MHDGLQTLLPFILIVVLLVWLVFVGRKRFQQAPRGNVVTDRVLDQRQKLQHAMEQLQVNLMEFGRDAEARLDTKIRTLSQLIQDADERIKRMEQLTGAAPSRADGEVPPLHKEIYRLADEGLDKVEIARRTSSTPGEVELILGLRRTRGV